MDDCLPVKWQQLFALLERELQQASPTSMSQGLQDFLQFMLTHKGQYAKLAQYGADLDFVTHVLYTLVGFPTKRLHAAVKRWLPRQEDRQVVRQTRQALAGIECLDGTIAHNGFAALSDALQTAIRSELSGLRTLSDSFDELLVMMGQKVEVTDPLSTLLAHARPGSGERGRPSAKVPTLFMVLLTDHLQERTGHRRYREIGLVTSHLFAGSISKGVVQKPNALRVAVQDRCKKFRQTHDVAALRAALLAPATPFLEQPWAR
jgi:hypothetical protein